MTINYTYEIIAVDEAARCMEVVYSSDGRETMHIGARLPFVGEDLEQIIRMYAPIAHWEERERAVQVPQVGVSGTMAPVVVEETETSISADIIITPVTL